MEPSDDGGEHLIGRAMNLVEAVSESPLGAENLADRILNGLSQPGVYRVIVDLSTWTLLKWIDDPCPYFDWHGRVEMHPEDREHFAERMTAELEQGTTTAVLRLPANDGEPKLMPESIMPNYPWLLANELDYTDVADRMKALRYTGVPYSLTQAEYEKNVKDFGKSVAEQLDISQAKDTLLKQARTYDYDGLPNRVTEMEALVAYLQVLGTMVDFSKYDEGYFANFR